MDDHARQHDGEYLDDCDQSDQEHSLPQSACPEICFDFCFIAPSEQFENLDQIVPVVNDRVHDESQYRKHDQNDQCQQYKGRMISFQSQSLLFLRHISRAFLRKRNLKTAGAWAVHSGCLKHTYLLFCILHGLFISHLQEDKS